MTTILDCLTTTVARFPHKPAAIYEGAAFAWAEVDARSSAIATALRRDCGLIAGDTVAVAMPNCVEYLMAYWGIVRAGGVVAAVNTRLGPDEMAYVLGDSGARVLLSHERVWEAVSAGLADASAIEHVYVMGAEAPNDARPFAELTDVPDDKILPDAELAEDGLAVVAYTSGTTGRPKGAMMRHCDLLFNVRACLVAHSFRHEDVHMLALPMFHCTALYSLLPTSAYLGSVLAIAPRPDKSELLDLIESARVTDFLGPPTLFAMIAMGDDLARCDTTSLRLIAYAGSPMHPDTIRRLREALPHVALRNFFGLTETTSVTHVLPGPDALSHADSVGKPLPEVRSMVADAEGVPVPVGETGELLFHRANVIPGYWKKPGVLDESIRGEWFRTGDLAHVDADGYLYVHGREKDVIIVSGENVMAAEVEAVIEELAGVRECAVVGVEATGIRAYLGELVKAVVVCEADTELSERDVKRQCAGRLASYQMPMVVEFRDELPRNPAGKVLKRELK